MSFVSTAPSAMSSPAMLGIKEHRDSIRDYQRAQSAMQFYNYQGDGTIHKKQYTGKQRLRLDASPLSGTVSPQQTGPLGSTIASLLGPKAQHAGRGIQWGIWTDCSQAPAAANSPPGWRWRWQGRWLCTLWAPQPVCSPFYI